MNQINRSRAAILAGAKIVIAEVGSYESNMVEIANRSQVSRATIYNHFSDKEEMMNAVLGAEVERLISLANQINDGASALVAIAMDIAHDPALAMMIKTDLADVLAIMSIHSSDEDDAAANSLRAKVLAAISKRFSCDELAAQHIYRWILSFVLNPARSDQIFEMANWLLAGLNLNSSGSQNENN